MLFDGIFNSSLLFLSSVIVSFSGSGLSFYNVIVCFASLSCFFSMNLGHSFIGGFNNSCFFFFNTIVDTFVDWCLIFNSFHFISYRSLFWNFSVAWRFGGAGDGSDNVWVWSFSWNSLGWCNSNWNGYRTWNWNRNWSSDSDWVWWSIIRISVTIWATVLSTVSTIWSSVSSG